MGIAPESEGYFHANDPERAYRRTEVAPIHVRPSGKFRRKQLMAAACRVTATGTPRCSR